MPFYAREPIDAYTGAMANVGKPVPLEGSERRRKRLGRRTNPVTPVTLAENVTESVKEIISDERLFRLREPINLKVRHSGPYCLIAYSELGIEGYGRNEDEALRSFADVFSATWDAYAEEEDSKLTQDARVLKQKLIDLVAGVRTA